MPIQTPDILIKKTWHRIPKNIKVTFITSFLVGILTHMYMITSTLPNHDEFRSMAESLAWGVDMTGRWLKPAIGDIVGIFTLPWINGLILVIFFAISSCLVVSMMKVKNNFYSALISGIMVTIPMVASFMTYMGVIPVNIGSILLLALAAFLAIRYKFGFIFAVIPIALSLALYQASFSVVAALLVMALILEVLDGNTSWQKTLLNGIKYIATLIGGLLLYLLSIRIIMPDGIVGAYQGVDQMGQINWAYLPLQIRTAYITIARFFLEDYRNYHYPFMNILFVLSFAACAALIIILCIRKKLYKEPIKLALLAVLLLLFPFACNLVYIMGASWIHDLMIYATVFILVFLIVIVDRYRNELKEENSKEELNKEIHKKKMPGIIANISTWIITITIALSMFNYVILTNQAYYKLNIGYQVTYAQSILLLSRIQSLEGYREDMDVVIVGSPHVPQGIPELQNITMIGVNGPELLLDSWAYTYFLQRHLNFPNNVEHHRFWDLFVPLFHGDEETIALVEFVRDMPVYPLEGSMKIVDDTIFIRFRYLDELPPYRTW